MGAKGAYIVRLLMVGDSSCGKTSLVLRFDQNVFSTKFVTTIGVDYRDKMVKIEGVPMRLQLWDTAGQERFRSLTSNFFGRADGFVLTYDISNRPSFDHVIGWMRDIKTRAPPDCDIVLCGNKSDLDNHRVITMPKENNWQRNTELSSLKHQPSPDKTWKKCFTDCPLRSNANGSMKSKEAEPLHPELQRQSKTYPAETRARRSILVPRSLMIMRQREAVVEQHPHGDDLQPLNVSC